MLLEHIEDDDQLWEYCTPPEAWRHRAGRGGFAIVRDGKVVTTLDPVEQ